MLGWSLIAPAFLGATIAIVEFRRDKKRGPVDLFTAVNAVFFLCFVMTPPFLRWAADQALVPREWRALLLIDQDSPLFVVAGFVVWLSYIFVAFGYFSGREKPAVAKGGAPPGLLLWGAVLLAIGGISIFVYASQIGGVRFLLESVMQFRAQGDPVYTEFAFLKTFSVIATGSSVLFFGAVLEGIGHRAVTRTLLAISILVSLLTLGVSAGRLSVIEYLLMFPLYSIVRRRTLSIRLVVAGAIIFFAFAVLGHGIFDIFHGRARLEGQVSSVALDPAAVGIKLMLEFAFPWVNVAAALDFASAELPLRWFLDIPLGIAYLTPKRLFGVELPPTVSMEMFDLMGAPFPADLITFGLYSAYIPGALLVAWVFGRVVRVLESRLPVSGSASWLVLRAAWIAYIGSRVMYGNPHHTFVTVLPLVAASLVFLVPTLVRFRARVVETAS